MKRFRLLVLLAAVLLVPGLASGQIVEYAHLDAVGNIRAVSDQNGAVIERHDYLPFGEECLTGPCASNPNAGAGQPRKFTGKERDTETGLDYFGARYYRANVGRFTTVDPSQKTAVNLLDPQRWNPYAYALNNPLRYVDPDGRDALWVKHANGSATLVIPVKFSGAGATEANVAAIVNRVNGVTLLDPNVSVQAIATDRPIKGKLNHLDLSPGLDTKLCGPVGECVNGLGSNRGHIDSTSPDLADAAKHDIFHFAGVADRYRELDPDEQGRRRTEPSSGFTNSNVMSTRGGTELTASQLQEAKNNRTTRKCSGEGAQCR